MKRHKKHIYREYPIFEYRWLDYAGRSYATFRMYDDENHFLGEAKTLDRAKDWIDAEQAGEHD